MPTGLSSSRPPERPSIPPPGLSSIPPERKSGLPGIDPLANLERVNFFRNETNARVLTGQVTAVEGQRPVPKHFAHLDANYDAAPASQVVSIRGDMVMVVPMENVALDMKQNRIADLQTAINKFLLQYGDDRYRIYSFVANIAYGHEYPPIENFGDPLSVVGSEHGDFIVNKHGVLEFEDRLEQLTSEEIISHYVENRLNLNEITELFQTLDSLSRHILLVNIADLSEQEILAFLQNNFIESGTESLTGPPPNARDAFPVANHRFYLTGEIDRSGNTSDTIKGLYLDRFNNGLTLRRTIVKTPKRRALEEGALKSLSTLAVNSRKHGIMREARMAAMIRTEQNSGQLHGLVHPVLESDCNITILHEYPYKDDLHNLPIMIIYLEERFQSFEAALNDRSVSNQKFYRAFANTIRTVASKHQRGFVHRDLKPSNLGILDEKYSAPHRSENETGLVLDLSSMQPLSEVPNYTFVYYTGATDEQGNKITKNVATKDQLMELLADGCLVFTDGITPEWWDARCAWAASKESFERAAEDFCAFGRMLKEFSAIRKFPDHEQETIQKIIAGLQAFSRDDENYQFVHGIGEGTLHHQVGKSGLLGVADFIDRIMGDEIPPTQRNSG